MLLNSMAAACMQFIWVMVCIPNHSMFLGDLHANVLLLDNKKGLLLRLLQSILLPEAAVAV